MNRCVHLSLTALLLAAFVSFLSPSVQAQTDPADQNYASRSARPFPQAALRGELTVQAPPEITLNGKTERLTPGARIFNADNNLVLSGSLINQKLLVNYMRDASGQVHQVWILTRQEAAEKRPGLPENNFFFGFSGLGKPSAPVENGKTPLNQPPRYNP